MHKRADFVIAFTPLPRHNSVAEEKSGPFPPQIKAVRLSFSDG